MWKLEIFVFQNIQNDVYGEVAQVNIMNIAGVNQKFKFRYCNKVTRVCLQ